MNIKNSLQELVKYYQDFIQQIQAQRNLLQQKMSTQNLNDDLLNETLGRWNNLEIVEKLVKEKIHKCNVECPHSDSNTSEPSEAESVLRDKQVSLLQNERKLIAHSLYVKTEMKKKSLTCLTGTKFVQS